MSPTSSPEHPAGPSTGAPPDGAPAATPPVTEQWVVTGPHVIEVDDVRALHAAVIGGRVDVVGRDEPGARIEVHSVRGRPLEIALVDGELRLGYAATLVGWEGFVERWRDVRLDDAVEVHLAVHRDVAVRLGTVTGDALLAGVTHGGAVSTVSGTLVTDSTVGALVTNAVSGELTVRDHRGDLQARAVSGSVTANGAFGSVSTTSVSGAVTLDAAATTGVNVQTVSGEVTVRLPRSLETRAAVRSVSGRVVVDGVAATSGPGFATVTVDQGEGVVAVSVRTVSGRVTILRSDEAPR